MFLKIEWNRKYTTISVYAVITALIIMLLGAMFLNFSAVSRFITALNNILIPVYIGFGVAYLANPIMKLSEKYVFRFSAQTEKRQKVKRSLSITLSMIVLLLALTVICLLIIPQVVLSLSDLTTKLPGYVDKTLSWLDEFLPDEMFSRADLTINNFLETFNTFIGSSGLVTELSNFASKLSGDDTFKSIVEGSFTVLRNYLPVIFGYVSGVASGFFNTILGIFFAIYMLASKERLQAQIKKTLRAFTDGKTYHGIVELGHFSNKTFGGYLLGKVLDSLVVGIVMFIACSLFRVPYAILLSTLVAITNIIPVIGPFIGAIPGVLIIFIVDPSKVLVFIIINIIIQQIDGNIIVPKLLGETTGLDSLWVLFSITVAGGLWGIFGMFICVPIFAILYMVLKLWIEKKLHTKELPTETEDYFRVHDHDKGSEHEENAFSFAARVKHSGAELHENMLSERLKKLFKKKTTSAKPKVKKIKKETEENKTPESKE